jgi:hypothetical protein
METETSALKIQLNTIQEAIADIRAGKSLLLLMMKIVRMKATF